MILDLEKLKARRAALPASDLDTLLEFDELVAENEKLRAVLPTACCVCGGSLLPPETPPYCQDFCEALVDEDHEDRWRDAWEALESKQTTPNVQNGGERANYLPAPNVFLLNHACATIASAYGPHVFLVGSCLRHRNYRDVDVRCILPDKEFDQLFPTGTHSLLNGRLSFLNATVSLYLGQQSKLPVDFQFQRSTEANRDFGGERHALGIFLTPKDPTDE